MAKSLYMRTMRAGRLVKSVRYMRPLPADSGRSKAAKTMHTKAAQRFINAKNCADRFQLLLYANFDSPRAHFVTFTYDDEGEFTMKPTKVTITHGEKSSTQILQESCFAARLKGGTVSAVSGDEHALFEFAFDLLREMPAAERAKLCETYGIARKGEPGATNFSPD